MVWAERKVAARLQQRFGPYLVGPLGPAAAVRRRLQAVLQGGAAAEGRRQVLFYLAPVISAAAAFAAFCVVPFGPPTDFFGLLTQPIPLYVADVNVGGAGRLRHRLDGRLRHRARGLELATASTRCSAACARRRR